MIYLHSFLVIVVKASWSNNIHSLYDLLVYTDKCWHMLTCRMIISQCCQNYLDLMVDPPYLSCPDLVLPLFFPLFSTHFPYSPQKQWAALNMYLWELWGLIWRRKKTRLKVLVPFIGRKMLCIKCLLQVNKERLMHLISNAYYGSHLIDNSSTTFPRIP